MSSRYNPYTPAGVTGWSFFESLDSNCYIKAISSDYDNGAQDRNWRVQAACITSTAGESYTSGSFVIPGVTGPTGFPNNGSWNSLNGDLNKYLSYGYMLDGLGSVFDATWKDRYYEGRGRATPAEFETGTCAWLPTANAALGPLGATCSGTFSYFAGVSSTYDNTNKDRIWKYYCCAMAPKACPAIPALTNGTWVCPYTTVGAVCNQTCSLGSRPSTSGATVTCQSNKSWTTSTATCNLGSCGSLPTVAHGSFSCSSGSLYGASCSLGCDDGYQPSAPTSISCGDTGTAFAWSTPSNGCGLVSAYCDAAFTIAPEHGSVDCGTSPQQLGTVCSYSCNAGYILATEGGTATTRTCATLNSAQGQWTGGSYPVCVLDPAYCSGVSAPTHGEVNCDNRALGGSCVYECTSGYQIRGQAAHTTFTTTCTVSDWSAAAPVCDPVECSTLSLLFGGVTCSAGMHYPSTCTAFCNEGFDLSGAVTAVTCNANAQWNATLSALCTVHYYTPPASNNARTIALTAGLAAGVVCLLLLALILIIYWDRRRRHKRRRQSVQKADSTLTRKQMVEMSPAQSPGKGPDQVESKSNTYAVAGQRKPVDGDLKQSAEHTYATSPERVYSSIVTETTSLRQGLVLGAKLGSGVSGVVFRGQLPSNLVPKDAKYLLTDERQPHLAVAVKTIPAGADPKSRREFIEEARMMARFDNPNVVRAICSLLEAEPLLCVLELMPFGDLRGVLQRSIKVQVSWTRAESAHALAQVARGLDYLEQIRFVHRDIAARNCLVGANLAVKISDFGLSRAIAEENDYYRMETKGRLPVKWMAPECLMYRKFTHQSDVWAFGVLAWEVYAYGASPYGNQKGPEILAQVEGGFRLPKPAGCDDVDFEQVFKCWNREPLSRPSFATLSAYFAQVALSAPVRDIGLLVSS
ncbi:hypothetical protein CAOG_08470 [Capsaspora owczarzaki ATCC 30864]|uniref:TKL protein kinase n=1 Tax=Capsaspora owczarzaki (strain ATCC 30864) TaxID=595528 RepID=A0A0D2X0U2_CAPO3|nr:hypothetical protein CAOG_08470 [Capsaspora owczarzaki ATCC 30864]KJE89654.1 TKL protein kinase [Capsaspora owczarzaki ATCC 30864]|eukprot:XP_011270042.1 hypothetical protein CAOG_08470 [Capsaspora owczarzaki ATCC 30864]